MKHLFKTAAVLALAAVTLVGCSAPVPANTVFGADDLPGKVIGVQESTTGDIFVSDFEEEGSTIERYSKGNDAVQALKQGKVDCVVIDDQPAKAFIEGNDDLTILPDPFVVESYAIAISKENTQLLDDINSALATLRDDGTLQNIIDGYISESGYKYESAANAYPGGQLIMATNAYFPPYEFYENNEITGLDADVARAFCDLLGYELVIEDMEFNSILAAIQTGKADFGMAGMTVTEERQQSVNFTESYATGTQVIIVRAK